MIKKIGTWAAVIALAFFALTDHSGTATLVHDSVGALKYAGHVLGSL